MLLEMQQSGSILPKSAAGQAISYMLNRWEMSFYKLDTSFVLKTGHFYLLPTLQRIPLQRIPPTADIEC